MKTFNFKTALILVCCFSLFSIACKKATSDVNVTDEVQASVQSDDDEMFQSETETVDDDITNSLSSSARFCGAGNVFVGGNFLPPDVDTSNPGNIANRMVFTFNGTVHGCRKRTGTITVDLLYANKWIEPGATLRIKFTNFKVEDVCRNRSITINGERLNTNVNGGNLFRLSINQISMLRHRIRTGTIGIEATFTDSSGSKTAVWNVAKNKTATFTVNPNKYNFEVSGDTTINGKVNTAAWGTTRFGKSYQTVYTSSVKSNTHCKVWRPTSGLVAHTVGAQTVQVVYGLNAQGNPVGPGDCATHFKVYWTNNNTSVTNSRLVAYR
ncbi:MAG: hypothetical protein KGZ59_08485 [Chitinophagaceae bacterium]|nr:hypothetical protein [Chitinophagaceae bacterium]